MSSESTPLVLFREGLDTVQIEEFTGLPEWQVLKMVSKYRSSALGLPDPYTRATAPVPDEIGTGELSCVTNVKLGKAR